MSYFRRDRVSLLLFLRVSFRRLYPSNSREKEGPGGWETKGTKQGEEDCMPPSDRSDSVALLFPPAVSEHSSEETVAPGEASHSNEVVVAEDPVVVV